MYEYRDELMASGLSTERFSLETSDKVVSDIYLSHGLEKPIVVTMGSPFGCLIARAIISYKGSNLSSNLGANLGANLGSNLRANLGNNLWSNLWDNLGKNLWANLGNNIGDNLRANLWDNLRDNLWDNLEDNLGNNLEDNLGNNIGDNLRANLRASLCDNLWDNLEDNLGNNLGANLRDNLGNNLGNSLRANLGNNLWADLGNNIGDNLWSNIGANLSSNLGNNLGANLGNNLRASLCDNLWNNLGDNLCANIGANLRASLCDSLWANLGANLRANLWDNSTLWGSWSFGWLAFCEFPLELGHTYPSNIAEKLSSTMRHARTCGGWLYAYPKIAFQSQRPTVIARDAAGRLHHETSQAMLFADGYGFYSWHGYRLPTSHEWLIAEKHKITPDHIEKESNAELRRIALEIFGFDRYLAAREAKVIATDELHGQPRRLLSCKVGGEKILVLEVINGSDEPDGSRRKFHLGAMRGSNPHECIAASFGRPPKKYREAVGT